MYTYATNQALLGIQRAYDVMDRSAANIARGQYDVSDIANVKISKHAAKANLLVIRTADEMSGHLIDILA